MRVEKTTIERLINFEMKTTMILFSFLFFVELSFANLKYHPISFVISTDKESYYEGEKITFNISITNTSKEFTYPVLLPHLQNVGQKLFFLTIYDKANNTINRHL